MALVDTHLLAQQSPWQILAVRVVFFLVGLIMVGVGYYAIKNKRLLMSGRQKRFLSLFGVEELTGKWATIGGVVQLLIGLVLVTIPVAGPYFGLLAMNKAPRRSQLRRPTPSFNPPMSRFEEPEDDYEEPAPLTAAEVSLSPLDVDSKYVISSRPFGHGHTDTEPAVERGPEGGVMVGVRMTKGGRRLEELASVQFIYQVDDRYVLGQVIGNEGPRVYREMAKPGFVVGGVGLNLFAGEIRGLKLIYYPFQDGQISMGPIDGQTGRYESDVLGEDFLSRNDVVDPAQTFVGFRAFKRRERLESLRFDFVDTGLIQLESLRPEPLPQLTYPSGIASNEVRFYRRVAGGSKYEDRAPAGGVLVGFRIFVPRAHRESPRAHGEKITCLQPIYQTGERYSVGSLSDLAFVGSSPTTLLAKPGYAVGGWTFSGRADGMKIKFMQLQDSRLVPDESYESELIGVDKQEETQSWESPGDLVVGLQYLAMGSNFATPALLTPTSEPAPQSVPQSAQSEEPTKPTVAADEEDPNQSEPIVRTWTSDTGKEITAKLIKFDADAEQVTLQRPGRRPITIPITKLSEADQVFLRELGNR